VDPVCELSAEETECEYPSADNTQTGSTFYLHLFGTYDVAYAHFHQDPFSSLKMALQQRRNMYEQD
jgi:hypothetical protein